MGRTSFIFACASALLIASAVQADLIRPPVSSAGSFAITLAPVPAHDSVSTVSPDRMHASRAFESSSLSLPGRSSWKLSWGSDEEPRGENVTQGVSDTGEAAADSGEVVIQLPPAPSSVALAITGMLPMGAWQLVRSARKMHLGSLPDWYHASAPERIGHATLLDLQTTDLPVCVLEIPAPPEPRFTGFDREAVGFPLLEYIPCATAPRGPPFLS
jgi:hypothetical protein